MPIASNKITEFPGAGDALEPIAALPAGFLTQDRDPTREIRNLIDELQDTVRESRRRHQQAEAENEQLRGKLHELQEKSAAPVPAAQLETLTRERDLLLEQQAQFSPVISDLKHRLKLAENEISAALCERDAMAAQRKQVQRLLDDAEKKFAEAARQKETAMRPADPGKDERERARKEIADAQKSAADAQRALVENRKALSDAQRDLNDARKALTDAQRELAAMRKKGGGETSPQLDALRQARDGMADQITQLKQQITVLEDQLADANYERELAEKLARQTSGDTAQNTDGTHELLMETRSALTAAQQQIEEITRERDSLQAQLAESTITFEARLTEQSAEIERLAQALNSNEGKVSERHEMESHFEKRRLDMIELNTKLENAHREIRNLSASLAEARLQAKLAGKTATIAAPVRESAPQADEVATMRRSFQAFSRDLRQIGLLGELETHTLTIADRAMEESRPILHRVATAFASLLGDLQEVPEQIGQSTLRTLNQGIEFISQLLADAEIEKSVQLDDVRVFVVDDDANTCATILAALNLVGIHADHTQSSGAAIAELASSPYDLILLDVHMPDLDGFELAAQIRNMGPHAETPIFFITGDTSLENRAKSSLRGANEFIAKPFSVQELALKSLKSVLTGQFRSR